MWFLLTITLLNAVLDNKDFVLQYRIEVQGFPINIFDFMMVGALVYALVRRGMPAALEPCPKGHPLLPWVISLYLVGVVVGLVQGIIWDAPMRQMVTYARNFIAIPIFAGAGYMLLASRQAAGRFPMWQVLAGVLASAMILANYGQVASSLAAADNLDKLRVVQFVTPYAGIGACVAAFVWLSGVRKRFSSLVLPAAVLCIVAQVAPMHRSDWVSLLGAMLVMLLFMLPREHRLRSFRRVLVVFVAVAVAVWISFTAISAISGRDLLEGVSQRFMSLVPWLSRDYTGPDALGSRLPGLNAELRLWLESPWFGQGFGVWITDQDLSASMAGRHNVWTNTLAETGLFGFAAHLALVGGCIILGRRMIKQALAPWDRLMGVMGMVSGVYFLINGATTQSFNILRVAMPLAINFGVLLRARAYQNIDLAEARVSNVPADGATAEESTGDGFGLARDEA